MPVEHVFDLRGIDVLAAADVHVLDPVDDPHPAVGRDGGHVTGVQPAAADRFCGFLRPPQYPGVTLAPATCNSPASPAGQIWPSMATRHCRCHIGTPTSPGSAVASPGGVIVTTAPASLMP